MLEIFVIVATLRLCYLVSARSSRKSIKIKVCRVYDYYAFEKKKRVSDENCIDRQLRCSALTLFIHRSPFFFCVFLCECKNFVFDFVWIENDQDATRLWLVVAARFALSNVPVIFRISLESVVSFMRRAALSENWKKKSRNLFLFCENWTSRVIIAWAVCFVIVMHNHTGWLTFNLCVCFGKRAVREREINSDSFMKLRH